ncbi:MAG: THUMP domain-containing protein [Nanoarchaeota archaeon]
MFEILLKTKEFIDIFAKEELKKNFNIKYETLNKGLYLVKFDDKKTMINFVYNILFYSRCFEKVFLKICQFEKIKDIKNINLDFIKTNLTFEVDATNEYNDDKKKAENYFGQLINKNNHLEVDLSNPQINFHVFSSNKQSYLGLDLLGFNLSKRDYKINTNHSTINSLVITYALNLLELNKLQNNPKIKNYTIIDTNANLGDLIIESSLFNPRNTLNMKKKFHLPIYKIFSQNPPVPQDNNTKNKFIAIVQNNKIFKQIKENIKFHGTKIKVSQYELDWLDVKFKKNQIDYGITQLPIFKENDELKNYLNTFFYQIEFIISKKFIIISKKKIDKKYYSKYKTIQLKTNQNIKIGKQDYYIYLFEKESRD